MRELAKGRKSLQEQEELLGNTGKKLKLGATLPLGEGGSTATRGSETVGCLAVDIVGRG